MIKHCLKKNKVTINNFNHVIDLKRNVKEKYLTCIHSGIDC